MYGKTVTYSNLLDDLKTFLRLTYNTKLRKLSDIDTLKSIFDKYNLESDSKSFMKTQGEALIERTEVEHLVYDPDGIIYA